MARAASDYLAGTRHPWTCTLFVLPLLIAYEGGLALGGDDYRNGAETWLRHTIAAAGINISFTAPILLSFVLLAWSLWRRNDKPRECFPLIIGMFIESCLFAVGLYLLSYAFLPVADSLAPLLQTDGSELDPGLARVLGYLGAGIYEEALFRLGLFSLICWLCFLAEFSPLLSLNLAAISSALLFAAAHHLGPAAETFQGAVFVFRTLAGFYFAWLYLTRGLGVAVGAHTGYDVLVGLLLPNL